MERISINKAEETEAQIAFQASQDASQQVAH
jgi:hypothetical protein